MRPANNFQRRHDHHQQRTVKGPRPGPLKISKESRLIHKTSSSASEESVGTMMAPAVGAAKQQQRSHPVIIYTHSPKVIHTLPRDFMALVQRLTGNSSHSLKNKATRRASTHQELVRQDQAKDDATSRPASNGDINESSSVMSSTNEQNGSANFADIPLFTPNFLMPVHRYSSSVHPSPNMGSSVSPSVLEFMKGLPEYSYGFGEL